MLGGESRLWGASAALVALAIGLAFAVIALVVLKDANAAGQRQLSCGETITTDATLHRDLGNCPNNGIVIGADHITLALTHHASGRGGTPAAGCDFRTEFCDIGVVNDGHDGVTMMNGPVREFAFGVFFGSARHNRVLGLSASRPLLFRPFGGHPDRSVVRNGSF